MTLLAGIDIGGTKCAVSLGRHIPGNGKVEILRKAQIPTPKGSDNTLFALVDLLQQMTSDMDTPAAIGISCGGPLDSRKGMIYSPPNLPGWERVHVTRPFAEHFGVPVEVQNDANACALAEWAWGAGRGTQNMVFLTFGTGMGAGLILDGKLYSGTNDMAGEIGHVRMEEEGPIGFGKAGSFEGFCSGGGIAQIGRQKALQALGEGISPMYCPTMEDLEAVTAEKVGKAAMEGDATALDIIQTVGKKLGRGAAFLVDVLNPERIVIGSIYGRLLHLLAPIVTDELEKEALPLSLSVCRIVPAGLGEQVGDYASLAVALKLFKENNTTL